jgi:hypothetical protein
LCGGMKKKKQNKKKKYKFEYLSLFCFDYYFVEKCRLYAGLRPKPFVNKDKYCGGIDDKYE